MTAMLPRAQMHGMEKISVDGHYTVVTRIPGRNPRSDNQTSEEVRTSKGGARQRSEKAEELCRLTGGIAERRNGNSIVQVVPASPGPL